MRRILCTGLVVCGSIMSQAHASVIAIVDSGVDYKHEKLSKSMWVNPADSTFDRIDNDGNGFTDDVYGWNFIENSSDVINYKYGSLYDAKIDKFFSLQDDALQGKASAADIDWLKNAVSDKAFYKQLFTYGNYAHGTHVSGIAQAGNVDSKILAVKLIPTENPLAGIADQVQAAAEEGKSPGWIATKIIQTGLGLVAKAQGTIFAQVGAYAGQQKADVANLSLGIGVVQARMIVAPLLKLAAGGKMPPAKDVDSFASFFLERLNIEQETMLNSAPETLFVFAAGNDGLSNDIFPTAPASIQNERAISVAAVYPSGKIAPFSNFGQKVDVAAVGVAVLSSVPDNHYLKLSGTSQASPYVAGVAGHIKDLNPSLTAREIKEIIMKTVDVKAELAGKVKSSGIVNAERAYAAAAASQGSSLRDAIAMARNDVADLALPRSEAGPSAGVFYMPWQAPFLF